MARVLSRDTVDIEVPTRPAGAGWRGGGSARPGASGEVWLRGAESRRRCELRASAAPLVVPTRGSPRLRSPRRGGSGSERRRRSVLREASRLGPMYGAAASRWACGGGASPPPSPTLPAAAFSRVGPASPGGGQVLWCGAGGPLQCPRVSALGCPSAGQAERVAQRDRSGIFALRPRP